MFGEVPDETVRHFNILGDSRFVAVRKLGDSFVLEYVYRLERTRDVSRHRLATWGGTSGFEGYDTRSVAWARRDFRGIPLTATFVITQNDSYNHLEDNR